MTQKKRFLRTVENVVDVFKFLDYYQICNMEMTSVGFRSVVNRYRNELALCQLYQIQLIPEPTVTLTVYRRSIEITEDFYDINHSTEVSAVDEEFGNDQWTRLLKQKPPLYAFPDISFGSQIQHDGIDSFLLFIAKNEDDEQAKLCLELPLYPESVDDLRLIRFWLLQLSQVHFRWMDFGRFFFNPELVSALLSPSNVSLPSLRAPSSLLHCHHLSLKMGFPDEQHNERFLRFVSAFLVSHCLNLRCGFYFEGILELLLKYGHRIGSVLIPVGPVHSTVELHNLIIHHAENALNPLAMVSFIDFRNVDDFPWPDLRSSKCLGRTVENDLTHSKYSLSNLHFPNVNFTITIGHLHGSSEFKRFSIQRSVEGPKNVI